MRYELKFMLVGYVIGFGVTAFAYSGHAGWLGLSLLAYFASYLLERPLR